MNIRVGNISAAKLTQELERIYQHKCRSSSAPLNWASVQQWAVENPVNRLQVGSGSEGMSSSDCLENGS